MDLRDLARRTELPTGKGQWGLEGTLELEGSIALFRLAHAHHHAPCSVQHRMRFTAPVYQGSGGWTWSLRPYLRIYGGLFEERSIID